MLDADGNDPARIADDDDADLERFPLRCGVQLGHPYLISDTDAELIQRAYVWMRAYYEVRYGTRMLRPSGTLFEAYMLISQFQMAFKAYCETDAPARVETLAAINRRFYELWPEPWASRLASQEAQTACTPPSSSSSDEEEDEENKNNGRAPSSHMGCSRRGTKKPKSSAMAESRKPTKKKQTKKTIGELHHSALVHAFDKHADALQQQAPWNPANMAPVVW